MITMRGAGAYAAVNQRSGARRYGAPLHFEAIA